jgi:hypothetical protein
MKMFKKHTMESKYKLNDVVSYRAKKPYCFNGETIERAGKVSRVIFDVEQDRPSYTINDDNYVDEKHVLALFAELK